MARESVMDGIISSISIFDTNGMGVVVVSASDPGKNEKKVQVDFMFG